MLFLVISKVEEKNKSWGLEIDGKRRSRYCLLSRKC
ncbi:hypothetical protein TcasGA2_TC031374 [Tribolium castaneum]|uniref:Uncharacterized protein n=1 Tax=Tribolium castaneum TaxID=7070 RepID=A0A139WAZ9_TRICA|nr:hypothetical protein TcasGA2_TC031374 [Tribolium castaneum]